MKVDARIEVDRVLFEATALTIVYRVHPFPDQMAAMVGRGPGGGLAILPPPAREHPQEVILRRAFGGAEPEAPPMPDPEERLLFPLLDAVKRYLQTHPIFPAGPAAVVLAAPVDGAQLLARLPPTTGPRDGAA